VIVHVEAGGRARAVEVKRDNGRFIVTLDGRAQAVDVHEVGGNWSLIIGPSGEARSSPSDGEAVDEPIRSYEVAFIPASDGAMMVHVNGQPVPVRVGRGRGKRAGGMAAGVPEGTGPQKITAPMPGKVVKLLVKPGDRVEARHGLVVVEAMKMENELRARAPGVVAEVRVTEGASVEAGAILVVVE